MFQDSTYIRRPLSMRYLDHTLPFIYYLFTVIRYLFVIKAEETLFLITNMALKPTKSQPNRQSSQQNFLKVYLFESPAPDQN